MNFKIVFAIGLVFFSGYSCDEKDTENSKLAASRDSLAQKEPIMKKENSGKVTGIGGIFFKTSDPEGMKKWYADNLGLVPNEYGSVMEFRDSDSKEKAYLLWSPFADKTKYFEPSEKEFMVNFRVQNIEAIVERFKQSGLTVVDSIETFEYGKFVHVMDPDGNKIELWEPVDSVFEKQYEGKTTK